MRWIVRIVTKLQIAALLSSLVLVTATGFPAPAAGLSGETSPGERSPRTVSETLVVSREGPSGSPAFARVERPKLRSGAPLEVARSFLTDHRKEFRVDPNDLTPVGAHTDRLGLTHLRLAQRYAGIPVWGAQLVVHMRRADGGFRVTAVNGRTYPEVRLPVRPVVSSSLAAEIAAMRINRGERKKAPELVVLPWQGRLYLAWHLVFEAPLEPARYEVFVDALVPEVVFWFNSLPTGHGSETGSGTGVNGDPRTVKAFHHSDSLFYLWDQTTPVAHPTVPFGPGLDIFDVLGEGVIATYTMGNSANTSLLPGALLSDADNLWDDPAAVDAHFYAAVAEAYFRTKFGRVSIDDGAAIDGGMSIISSAHFGSGECNAFWNGIQLVFGDGGDCDGDATDDFKPFSGGLDVVAHELTHGVIQFTADLIYLNESGAMNESYADYFGNAIDNGFNGKTDGLIGDDICEPGGSICTEAGGTAARNMNNGKTMDDWSFDPEFIDSGGVHINSDIYNDVLWNIRDSLIASLGASPGADFADAIAYRALSVYLIPPSTFDDGRDATMQAARDLGATASQLGMIEQEFVDHEIGWEFVNAYAPEESGVAVQVLPQRSPKADGDRIVWVDDLEGNVSVFDTSTGTETRHGQGFIDQADVSGDRLVWAELPNPLSPTSGFRIRTRLLPGGAEQTIASSATEDHLQPRIDGTVVVWTRVSAGGFDVMWDDLATPDPPAVLNDDTLALEEFAPVVSSAGTWGAWMAVDVPAGDIDVYTRNLPAGAPADRTPTTDLQVGPEISGTTVVYLEDSDADPLIESIKKIDAAAGSPTTIKTTTTDLGPAAIDGITVAYSELVGTGGLYDLFTNNLDGTAETTVSNARGWQIFPSISGPRIVWEDNQNRDTDIYSNLPVETSAPSVVEVFPGPDAQVFPPPSLASAIFSETMDFRSIHGGTFTLSKEGTSTTIPSFVFYDFDVAFLVPFEALEADATYIATLSAPARDARGNNLSAFSWKFSTPTPPPPEAEPIPRPSDFGFEGFWLVGRDGGVFSFGDAPFWGSTGAMRLNAPIVGMAPHPSGLGYWFVAADGGVFSFGVAGFHGSTGSLPLNAPVVGMAPTPTGEGYWLVASDGGIFAFGDAEFFGSTGSLQLNSPIAGMAARPNGQGYWFVAADGGIFAFGDAPFHGSTGSLTLAAPIVGMAPTISGDGYWLVAQNGVLFRFGDAPFFGTILRLSSRIVGIAASPFGDGYWIAAADSRTFGFGGVLFDNRVGFPLAAPIVGVVSLP